MIDKEERKKGVLNRLKFGQDFVTRKLYSLSMPEYTIFSVYAVLIGVVVGFAAVFFHEAIHWFNILFFEQTTGGLYFLGAAAVILLPAIGMLIQSIMIKASPKTAKKRGVSEVIKSVALSSGYIPLRTTLFHFFAPVICIGSGGTVGPEGPAAQLGAGVASKLGHSIGLSDSRRRVFTAAGSGAAISAIFNSPLGGIFFALEIVLMNDFHSPTFTALILASVSASAVSRAILGNTSVFTFHSPGFDSYEQLYLFAILGLAAGILSVMFIRYSNLSAVVIKQKILSRIPRWIVMVSIGLLVGLSGYFYPEIFGIGYIGINSILADRLAWNIVLVLLLLKFILVPLMLNSGGFGGIFAPSLFIGAAFGYLYAAALQYFWGFEVDATTYILVSMGAVLGGVNTIPLASILIIFEMTKDYTYILPLMLAVILSTTLVQIFQRGSIHLKHLEEEGFRISHGRDANILRRINVQEVMRDDIVLIPQITPLPKLISQLIESPHGTFYVLNSEQEIAGTITENALRPMITEYESLKDVIVAGDIAKPEVITVTPENNLDEVLKIFSQHDVNQLPVIAADNPKNVLGTVWRKDVITAYNRESLKTNVTESLAQELKLLDKTSQFNIADGYSIVERPVKSEFIGKSLKQLRMRNRYHLEVLMIRQQVPDFLTDYGLPKFIPADPDYIICRGDHLIMFGPDDKIKDTSNWA